MGACTSAKKRRPDRLGRDTEQMFGSTVSEGTHQQLPEVRSHHTFLFAARNENLETEENLEGVEGVSESILSPQIQVKPQEEDQQVLRLAQSMHRLGRACQRESSFTESVKWLRSCCELYEYLQRQQDLEICVSDLALSYMVEGRHSEFLASASLKNSEDARVQFILSSLSNPTVSAAELVKRARELDSSKLPESPLLDCLLETAHMLRLWLRDYTRSLNLYEKALSLAPDRLSTYLFLGMTHRALGNVHEAVKVYRQALEFDPQYAEAWVNLGNLLFDDCQDLQHAEDCYLRALKSLERGYRSLVSPGKVYCLLAEVFFAQGFVYNALETSMKGIGADSLCVDNFAFAQKYAETLGCAQLAQFLKEVCSVLDGGEIETAAAVSEIEGRHRSVLLGALGELVQFCHRVVTKYNFPLEETEMLNGALLKMTEKQQRGLQRLYDIIG